MAVEVSHPLELGLQTVVTCHSAQGLNLGLCKSNKHSNHSTSSPAPSGGALMMILPHGNSL